MEVSMARTPRTPALIDAPLSQDGEALIAKAEAGRTEQDLTRLAASRAAQFAPALLAAGRLQALQFMTAVSESAIAQAFAQVRRDKSYIGMPYRDADGSLGAVTTLDEFCRQFLGVGYARCAELADNLHLLGPALYEQAQQIGWKTKDYRALRALPADDQEAVREALEDGDRDAALTVLSELVARHRQARESADRRAEASIAEREETAANYAAATQLLGERDAELRRIKTGAVPPPRMDERMAGWGPSATYCIGEAKRWLVQLGMLLDGAAQAAPDGDSPEQLAAWASALGLVDDACGVGLTELGDMVGGLSAKLEGGVSEKLWALRARVGAQGEGAGQ
jgi:hypothetical protein